MSPCGGTRKRLLESLLAVKSFLMYQHTAKAVHEQEAKRIANAARIMTGLYGEAVHEQEAKRIANAARIMTGLYGEAVHEQVLRWLR